MVSLLYSEHSVEDLRRLAEFLVADDPSAAVRTAELIGRGLEILETHPLIGRAVPGGLRELIVSHGRTGYIALYEYHPDRKSTRLNSSHIQKSRMPSSA